MRFTNTNALPLRVPLRKVCGEIREVCGDYALDVEYSKDFTFTMFFNSRRNAETVKRCIEVDDSVPNAATAVDFVEVVRCSKCKHFQVDPDGTKFCDEHCIVCDERDFCSCGERREK